MSKNTIGKWLKNARVGATMQSLMPSVVAVVTAIGTEGFSWWLALVAVAGVWCAHLACNLIDDYFDYKADMLKDRQEVVRKGIKAYTAKYPYLTDGSATLGSLRRAIAVFVLLAAACGLVVGWQREWAILLIALAAGLLGFFYSAPPIKFCYWGMGEVVTGLIFGPLLMAGVYWAASGVMDLKVLAVSVPIGLLVVNILYTHSMIDLEGDAASDKLTLAGVMKYGWAKLAMSWVINFAPYICVVVAVAMGWLHLAYLAVLLLLPRSIWLYWSLVQFEKGADFEKELEHPRRMLGPMPKDWAGIRKAGLDWFLIRWMTARNIVSDFCLTFIIVKVILLMIA